MKKGLIIVASLGVAVVCGSLFLLRHALPPNHDVADQHPRPLSASEVHPTRSLFRTRAVRLPKMDDAGATIDAPSAKIDGSLKPTDLQLTREQVHNFLGLNNRSAGRLLAAYWLCKDKALLIEAAYRFPNDPQVQHAVLAWNAFPDDRWRWLVAFKQTAPNNALANYLCAAEYFKEDATDKAMQELMEAAQKPVFDTYSQELSMTLTEAYAASGIPPGKGKVFAVVGTPLPDLAEVRRLSKKMSALAERHRQSGDSASADEMVGLGLALSRHINGRPAGRYLISESLSLVTEEMFMKELDLSAVIERNGQTRTVKQRLSDIAAQKEAIDQLWEAANILDLYPTMSDADLLGYADRMLAEGEYAAMVWLRDNLRRP